MKSSKPLLNEDLVEEKPKKLQVVKSGSQSEA